MNSTNLPSRLCVYPKDLVVILGCSESYARRMIRKIKQLYNKLPHQPATVTITADYLGIAEEEIRRRLM